MSYGKNTQLKDAYLGDNPSSKRLLPVGSQVKIPEKSSKNSVEVIADIISVEPRVNKPNNFSQCMYVYNYHLTLHKLPKYRLMM